MHARPGNDKTMHHAMSGDIGDGSVGVHDLPTEEVAGECPPKAAEQVNRHNASRTLLLLHKLNSATDSSKRRRLDGSGRRREEREGKGKGDGEGGKSWEWGGMEEGEGRMAAGGKNAEKGEGDNDQGGRREWREGTREGGEE